MKIFNPGLLGPGIVVNGVSLVLRRFHGGYRIFVNHQPCTVLPYGGYVANLNEASHVVERYRFKIISFAERAAGLN
ncbi:MAG: hypothetical protein FIB06_08505 [Betaproteobacteria bacterium]|nr:hypothetical protein [Betaproteobacteria bacterium]